MSRSVRFFSPGVLGRPDMVLWDRVYPNAQAIAAVVEAMLPTVTRLLDEHVGEPAVVSRP